MAVDGAAGEEGGAWRLELSTRSAQHAHTWHQDLTAALVAVVSPQLLAGDLVHAQPARERSLSIT